jgi:hypothetical protein
MRLDDLDAIARAKKVEVTRGYDKYLMSKQQQQAISDFLTVIGFSANARPATAP